MCNYDFTVSQHITDPGIKIVPVLVDYINISAVTFNYIKVCDKKYVVNIFFPNNPLGTSSTRVGEFVLGHSQIGEGSLLLCKNIQLGSCQREVRVSVIS